jgi:undecaprenyl pyrophosphate phosphatase UppP
MFDILVITAVQIIIESFPISSSAHVILAQHLWLKITTTPMVQVPAYFDDFLQGPTVLVLMVVFFKDWFSSVRRLFVGGCKFVLHKPLSWSERQLFGVFGVIISFMCAADVMTAFAYGIKTFMGKGVFGVPTPWVLVINFTVSMLGLLSLRFIGGRSTGLLGGCRGERPTLINIMASNKNTCSSAQPLPCNGGQAARAGGPLAQARRSLGEAWGEPPRRLSGFLTIKKSIIIGTVQGVALLCPGLSRFGSTYVVGRWLNLSPRRAFQFSFLIQFPLILATFIFKGLPGIIKASAPIISFPLLGTIIISTLIAGLLFAWAYRLARAGQLWWFGVYMIVPITFLILLIMG